MSFKSLDLGSDGYLYPTSLLMIGSGLYVGAFANRNYRGVSKFGTWINLTALCFAGFNYGRVLFSSLIKADQVELTTGSLFKTATKVCAGVVFSMGALHLANDFANSQFSDDEGGERIRGNIDFFTNALFGALTSMGVGSVFQGWRTSTWLETQLKKRGDK